MNAGERLTESVRIRVAPSEKQELEHVAFREKRSASFVGRRAITRELERLRKRSKQEG